MLESSKLDEPLPHLSTIDLADSAKQVAEKIDHAARTLGFLAIANHGVPDDLIARIWERSQTFFDLPIEAKMTARHQSEAHHPYGYFPMGQETLARSLDDVTTADPPSAPFDLKETFNLGPGIDSDDRTRRFGGIERIWPATADPAFDRSFRSAWLDYFDAMEQLSDRLLTHFAQALDFDDDFFTRAHHGHLSALRAINYPPLDVLRSQPARGQLRAGAHSDYGTLTILLPGPGDGGLEIGRANGDWLRIQPVDGCFLINLGDLMQIWSGGRWPSTIHRVGLPPAEKQTERRQAIAYFCQPAGSARVVPVHDPESSFEFGHWLHAKFSRASTSTSSPTPLPTD